MTKSLQVQVLYPADGGEGLAKRKGVAARRGRKEASSKVAMYVFWEGGWKRELRRKCEPTRNRKNGDGIVRLGCEPNSMS